MSRQQLTSDQQRDRAHRLDQAAYVYRDFARGFDATDPAKAEEARRLATSLQMQGSSIILRLDRDAEIRAKQPPEPERTGTVVTEEQWKRLRASGLTFSRPRQVQEDQAVGRGEIETLEEWGEYEKAAGVERGGLDPFDAGPYVPESGGGLVDTGEGRCEREPYVPESPRVGWWTPGGGRRAGALRYVPESGGGWKWTPEGVRGASYVPESGGGLVDTGMKASCWEPMCRVGGGWNEGHRH